MGLPQTRAPVPVSGIKHSTDYKVGSSLSLHIYFFVEQYHYIDINIYFSVNIPAGVCICITCSLIDYPNSTAKKLVSRHIPLPLSAHQTLTNGSF
jgi:hypothetical protein